ncbi:unnamed protein product [Candidula unifasciata]|uniref:HMG box domain-containing protein n=1 Tax=Candidula unifasciata TaxID=100452 RepID=A0A8S3Z287_9EUPU|nr:unnamed protein product [Candidula unifasciata]
MPKKKSNGYLMFMIEEKKRILAETKQAPSMQEMAVLCNESWKRLSPEERATYNAMAKRANLKGGQDPDLMRLDNQGQIIALRKSAAQEAAMLRTREKQDLVKSWEGQDLLDIRFHVINFQVMYTDEPVDYYLPLEVGMVSFTLRDGITKHLHSFIDAGEVPHGNMHLALKHSENTHKIPLSFEQADSDFLRLWTRLEKFVVSDPHRDDVPPIFCLASEKVIVQSCLDYIHYHARTGEPNIFTRVYALEDLVMSLLLQSGKFTVKPSETQIHDSLLRNQWDYVSSIRCAYHDESDCSYCSLAIVKRLSFAIFDMLSSVLGFKLKEHHMPDESSNQTFTVKLPSSAARRTDTRVKKKKKKKRTMNSEFQPKPAPFELKELRKPNSLSLCHLSDGPNILSVKQNSPGESQSRLQYSTSIRPPPGFGPRPGFPGDSLFRPQVCICDLGSVEGATLASRHSSPEQNGSCYLKAPVDVLRKRSEHLWSCLSGMKVIFKMNCSLSCRYKHGHI